MKYEYWFANIKGISCRQKTDLMSKVKKAEELYYIEETALKQLGIEEKTCQKLLDSRKEWRLDFEYNKMLEKQVQMVTIGENGYPSKLRDISSPPYALYFKGKLPSEEKLSIAIVGARRCSAYGEAMAKKFAMELAYNDIQIISGLARGIDGAGQRAALEVGGDTFGILGSGVDQCYPMENYRLYQALQEKGGIISEQPLGMKPLRQNFPARNRIISGLADVVLVIETKEESGSLITADMALEQGKDVYALPGQITSTLSQGCHNLIKQGAGILLSPEDLLQELGVFRKGKMKKKTENKLALATQENMVYSCLDFEPKNPDQISKLTGLQVSQILNVLMDLELRGYVGEVSKNYYVKVE